MVRTELALDLGLQALNFTPSFSLLALHVLLVVLEPGPGPRAPCGRSSCCFAFEGLLAQHGRLLLQVLLQGGELERVELVQLGLLLLAPRYCNWALQILAPP